MSTKTNLLLIGIVIVFLILAGGYLVFVMEGDYIIYTLKTFGQTKYKLTVYAQDRIDGRPMRYVPIEVIQKIDSAEKKITRRKTNRSGIVVFRLLPGTYMCRGEGIYSGYTDFINLSEDMEIRIKIWIPVR